MTQPDELLPDRAANFSSLSAWSQKTQEDWEDEIDTQHRNRFLDAEDGFSNMLERLEDTFIVGNLVEIFTGVEDGDESDLGSWINNLFGGAGATTIPQSSTPAIGQTITQMWENWFGTTAPDDTPAEVAATFEAIRAAVAGGYTLQTFTASDAAWSVPPELATAVECFVGAIGGGGKGNPGATSTSSGGQPAGGSGGVNGGFFVAQHDPSTFASTLNITVGAAATTNGANGGTTSVLSGATTLASSVPNVGSSARGVDYTSSTSRPGSGGKGGDSGNGTSTHGATGGSIPIAAGGTAGTSDYQTAGSPTAGGAGSDGEYAALPICGGAGGGGGGSEGTTLSLQAQTGAAGGNGGFPGGGSGGGGAAQTNAGTATAGAAGTPANGMAFLVWK